MTYTLKFEHPHLPEGTEVGLGSLGLVTNGGTLEVDEEAERLFVASMGTSVEDAFKDSAVVSVNGSSTLDPSEVEELAPVVVVEEDPPHVETGDDE